MKMKKFFALFLVIALATISIAGCSKSSTASKDAKGDSTAAGTATTGSTAAQNKIKLSIFCASITENTPTGDALKVMADYINEKSGGSLETTLYYDTALGDATSMVEGLVQGTIDIGISGTAYFSSLVPEVEVFQLPFLFNSLDEARTAVEGGAKDIIFNKFEDVGIVGLAFWENGFRELTNNVKPIKTPDDLKGIKMRTLPSTVQVKCWEALGAVATQIDASELYTALQQGTVNAEENPLHEVVSRKFYEVQPYVTLTDHVYTPFMMGMSKITWDKLSDEQKTIIMDAAKLGQQQQRTFNEKATAAAVETLEKNGVTIEKNPDKDAFKKIATSVWSVFTDQYGTELLDIIQGKK